MICPAPFPFPFIAVPVIGIELVFEITPLAPPINALEFVGDGVVVAPAALFN